MNIPACPNCGSLYAYEDRNQFICPECAHTFEAIETTTDNTEPVITDANGTPLATGDDVIIIKDLKVKGSATAIKKGTKVKNIRLLDEPIAGHDIDARVEKFGAMHLKSSVVKKA